MHLQNNSILSRKKSLRGFTLIELIIVIAIIAILAVVVLVSVNNYISKSKDTAVKADMSSLEMAATKYMYENNGSLTGFNTSSSPDYVKISAAIDKVSNSTGNLQFHPNGGNWTACAQLVYNSTSFWCIDNKGKRLQIPNSTCNEAALSSGDDCSTLASIITTPTPAPLIITPTPAPVFSVSCVAAPNPATTTQAVTFTSTPSGGAAPYTYTWSNACAGSPATQNCTKTFSAGNYTAHLIVNDAASHNANTDCSVQVNSTPAPTGLTVSCYPSPSPWMYVNNSTKFVTSSVTGGSSPYTYQWSGAGCSSPTGPNNYCYSTTFTIPGSYATHVIVTSNGGSLSGSADCSISVTPTPTPTPTPLVINSCSVMPSTVMVNSSFTYYASVSGGNNGMYTYDWSGPCSYNSSPNSYCGPSSTSTPGYYTEYLTVHSGSQATATSCPTLTVSPTPTPTPLVVSCYPSPSPTIVVGGSTTFQASVSGGTGSYTSRSWSGVCSGSSTSCNFSSTFSGTFSESLSVTDSGGQTRGPVSCSSLVVKPRYCCSGSCRDTNTGGCSDKSGGCTTGAGGNCP